MVIVLEAAYLLCFRHKKRRPWTSLDVVLVEPGDPKYMHNLLFLNTFLKDLLLDAPISAPCTYFR